MLLKATVAAALACAAAVNAASAPRQVIEEGTPEYYYAMLASDPELYAADDNNGCNLETDLINVSGPSVEGIQPSLHGGNMPSNVDQSDPLAHAPACANMLNNKDLDFNTAEILAAGFKFHSFKRDCNGKDTTFQCDTTTGDVQVNVYSSIDANGKGVPNAFVNWTTPDSGNILVLGMVVKAGCGFQVYDYVDRQYGPIVTKDGYAWTDKATWSGPLMGPVTQNKQGKNERPKAVSHYDVCYVIRDEVTPDATGCSPGFWSNHFGFYGNSTVTNNKWGGVPALNLPNEPPSDVNCASNFFTTFAVTTRGDKVDPDPNLTLGQVLAERTSVGPSTFGFHAVAALLNAYTQPDTYSLCLDMNASGALCPEAVKAAVQTAWYSGDAAMSLLKDAMDTANNMGCDEVAEELLLTGMGTWACYPDNKKPGKKQ